MRKEELEDQVEEIDPAPSQTVDHSQLMRNHKLSPEQRLQEHQMALDLVAALEEAGKKLREKSK